MAVLNLGHVVGPKGKDGASFLRNLLDNSDFSNPVNQRGQTSYTGSGYNVDRWRIYSAATVSVTSAGLVVDATSVQANLRQNIASLPNGTFTFAAKVNGNIVYRVFSNSNGTVTTVDSSQAAFTGGHLEAGKGSSVYYVVIINSVGYVNTVEWAALYEGSCTAETLPEYVPKGYGSELAECMRYFVRIGEPGNNFECGIAQAALTTKANAPLAIPVPMRIATPTVTITSGTVKLRYGATDIDPTGVSVNAVYNGIVNLAFAASGLTQGRDYVVRLASATLDISADL